MCSLENISLICNLIINFLITGAEINHVLNENWRVVNNDLEDSIKETLLIIQTQILENLYTIIPYKELFVD